MRTPNFFRYWVIGAKIGLSFILFSCVTKVIGPFKYDNSNILILDVNPREFHSPDEIMNLLERSSIQFTLKEQPGEVNNDLTGGFNENIKVDPYMNTKSRGRQKRLFYDYPAEELKRMWQEGESNAINNNQPGCIAAFTKAIQYSSKYWKTYTEFGKNLITLKQYDEAIAHLNKAIAMNDIDYEAYLYRAKAYLHKQNKTQAKKDLTYAFMLNKNDGEVRNQLYYLLQSTGNSIRRNRYDFGFRVKKESDKLVTIEVEKNRGEINLALATCLVAWDYVENYKETMLKGKQDTLGLLKYKECLMTQALGLSALMKKQRDVVLPKQQSYLYVSIIDKSIDPIVLWEFGASLDPFSILLTTEAQKEKIVRYIERYVYVSSQYRG